MDEFNYKQSVILRIPNNREVMKRRKRKLYFLFMAVTSVSASIYCVFIYFGLFIGRRVNNFENKIDVTSGQQEFPRLEEKAAYTQLKKYKTMASLRKLVESVTFIDEFDDLYEKYRDLLVTDRFDKTNAAVVKYVHALSEEAEYYYRKLDKSRTRIILWPEMKGATRSDDLSIQFRMLYILTLAYGTNGTIYYKNIDILLTIKDCLKFMVSSERYDGEVYYGNWWHWQVGAPTYLLDILIIIKDKLKSEQLKQYTDIISEYVYEPYSKLPTVPENETFYIVTMFNNPVSSSQTVELARVVLGLGILQRNEAKISQSLVSLVKVMRPVTILDGFYKDGSYIEHYDIPYTGAYGNDLVKKLGDILVITHGSKLAISSRQIEPFVEIVERAFLPLVYRGEMIATVKGRAVSRQHSTTQIGSDVMYTLLNIASFGSAKNKKKLRESVKYWMRQNPDYYFSNARKYHDLQMKMNLLHDSTILGNNMPFIGAKMYASMDRFVQQTINYTLGISLYSNRISAFEAGNNENILGWHIADGAIYLYNYDDVQFRNAYWPTVDPYRIPGTTVDTMELNDELSNWQRFNSDQKWVGGVARGRQATVGMALNKKGFKNDEKYMMDLEGTKSWFIIEGQIVALGAGITGTTTASIETIVDNRLLNDAYNYEVWSDSGQINETTKDLAVNWLLLKSDNQRSSIGYYFPNRETVDIIFEIRYGTYKDININSNESMYTGTYRKFIIDHGQIPFNAKYAYVILPGITLADIIKYANSKTVNILENSAHIQAVQIINEGYLGINFWNKTGGTVMGISSNQPMSLMRLTNQYGNQQSYILSDPTQSDNVISLKVPHFTKVATMSKGIKYFQGSNNFFVDFTKTGGASKQFTVI